MPHALTPRRAAVLAMALCLLAAAPARAAAPLAPADGVFCGPKGATITIDSHRNLARIDGQVCGFPIIAADKLQSARCGRDGRGDERREFSLRLIDELDMIHDGGWYSLCRPLPPGP